MLRGCVEGGFLRVSVLRGYVIESVYWSVCMRGCMRILYQRAFMF